jgi:hypothetical protein
MSLIFEIKDGKRFKWIKRVLVEGKQQFSSFKDCVKPKQCLLRQKLYEWLIINSNIKKEIG